MQKSNKDKYYALVRHQQTLRQAIMKCVRKLMRLVILRFTQGLCEDSGITVISGNGPSLLRWGLRNVGTLQKLPKF